MKYAYLSAIIVFSRSSRQAGIQDNYTVVCRIARVIRWKGRITKKACARSIFKAAFGVSNEKGIQRTSQPYPTVYMFKSAAPPCRREFFMSV